MSKTCYSILADGYRVEDQYDHYAVISAAGETIAKHASFCDAVYLARKLREAYAQGRSDEHAARISAKGEAAA
ncbi:MAG: hypothetical protein AAGA29_05790 [Planctomycetota bacterium]